jgi:hypothetical protein
VRDDLPRSYADGCQLSFADSDPVDCVYGDVGASRTAVLWGDSHAAQWLPALDEYAKEQGWRLQVHTKSACSPMPVNLYERRLRRVFDECLEWRADVLKHIRQLEPEVVYVGSSRDYDILDGGRLLQSREIYPYWEQQLTTLVEDLDSRARKVVLLGETPFLNFDPVDCLADDSVSNCDPPKLIVVDRAYAAIEASAAENGGATLLSLNDVLCPGLTCPVVVDDIVVFRDNHHVTASYMEHLAEPVANLLEGRSAFPSPVPSPDASEAAG